MKKGLLGLFFILFSISVFSQNFKSLEKYGIGDFLNKDLTLSKYKLFKKEYRLDKDYGYKIKKGYFKFVKCEFNTINKLKYTEFVMTSFKEDDLPKVVEDISKEFGKPYEIFRGYWNWELGDFSIVLDCTKRLDYLNTLDVANTLSIYFYDKSIKIKREDEFSKMKIFGSTKPQHYRKSLSFINSMYSSCAYFHLEFRYMEKDGICSVFLCPEYSGKKWLFFKKIKFLIDGEVEEFDVENKKEDVVNKFGTCKCEEDGIIIIGKEFLRKIKSAETVKVRFEGEKYIDFDMSTTHKSVANDLLLFIESKKL